MLSFTKTVVVATTTVATAALDVHVTVLANGNRVTSTSTRSFSNLAPEITAATTSPIAWEFSGVQLTWPTTYIAYTGFSHIFQVTAVSACLSTTASLNLPVPTEYASLIYDAKDTPGPSLPPAALISYLNAQPTVIAQMGGPIGQSCDPLVGGVDAPATSTAAIQVTYSSTHILAEVPGTTVISTAIPETQPAATTTPPPPPPSPTTTPTPLFTSTSSSPPLQVTTNAAHAQYGFTGYEGWLAAAIGAVMM